MTDQGDSNFEYYRDVYVQSSYFGHNKVEYLTVKPIWKTREDKLQKPQISTKLNLTHDDFTCVFSIRIKFAIYFLGPQKESVFGVITDNWLHL